MRSLAVALFIQLFTLDCIAAFPVSQWTRFHIQQGTEGTDLERHPRSARMHSYVLEVFLNIFMGIWQRQDCKVMYNCQPLSPLHCNGEPSSFFFSDGPLPSPCSLDFRVSFDNSSVTAGVDLALYKAPEPASSNDTYEIWFLAGNSSNDKEAKPVLTTTVHSRCSGWQMFHLDASIMSAYLEANIVNIDLFVFKNDEELSFPCDKLHSLFIFNATAHQSSKGSSMDPPTLNPANTTYPDSTPSESVSNPFGKKAEELQYFTPVLNVFLQRVTKTKWTKRKWAKREAKTDLKRPLQINDKIAVSHQKPCQLLDHWVKVNSTYWVSGEEYSVMVPKIYNAKKCVPKEGYHGTCVPTKQKLLVVLLETNQGGKKRAFKKTFSELKITENCG